MPNRKRDYNNRQKLSLCISKRKTWNTFSLVQCILSFERICITYANGNVAYRTHSTQITFEGFAICQFVFIERFQNSLAEKENPSWRNNRNSFQPYLGAFCQLLLLRWEIDHVPKCRRMNSHYQHMEILWFFLKDTECFWIVQRKQPHCAWDYFTIRPRWKYPVE